MSETAPGAASFGPLSEDDLLSYAHVQSLAQIQNEISALRSAIPILLSPLLRAPASTTITPTSNPASSTTGTITTLGKTPAESHATPVSSIPVTDPVINGSSSTTNTNAATTTTNNNGSGGGAGKLPLDVQAEFRENATQVQIKVKSLVANLEKMCDTLEAAERVRAQEYDDAGNRVVVDEPLLRTNFTREIAAAGVDRQERLRPRTKEEKSREEEEEQVKRRTSAVSSNRQEGQDGTAAPVPAPAAAAAAATGVTPVPTNALEHLPGLGAPLSNPDYLFGTGPGSGVVGSIEGGILAQGDPGMSDSMGGSIGLDAFTGNMYDDFGLESYVDDWTNFAGDLHQS